MKKKILILSVAFLSLTTLSCKDDYLDTLPTSSVEASAAFATTKNATAAINGIYRAMVVRYQSSQGYFGYPALMIIQDILGEDLVFSNTSNGWHQGEGRWLVHRNENGNLSEMPYEMYYRLIGNANLAIANLPNAAGPKEDRDRLMGEALSIRGFAYFNLVQLYGKRYDAATKPNSQLAVPLVLEPTTQGLPRNTVEEVYAQVNKDLTEAIAILPSDRAAKSHINKEVATGLLARVALVQQRWADAATYAAAARKGFTLMSIAQYQDGFADVENPEWMWGFDHIEDQTEYFGAFHSYISDNFNSSVNRQTPKVINSLLYNKIPETDIRSKMWVKAPTAANSIAPPGGVRAPYMVQKFRLPGTPSTSTMGDVPYMRAGEMYLVEAEALAKQGKDADAAKLLFDFVTKRDPAYKLSANTGTDLISEIYFQRRIELWGEGHRFLDLKRLNMPLNRNGANHNAAAAVIFDVPAGDVMWEFLIPRRELNANKAAVQNPL